MANQYEQLINIMRNQGAVSNPPTLDFGVVKSINPLQIVKGELPLFQENLYISKDLLGYTENVSITINGNTNNATIVHDSVFQVDNTVILYPVASEENQKYIVLGVI